MTATGDSDEVVFVVIAPDGQMEELRADGRPDTTDPDDPYQFALWTAVRKAIAPGILIDPVKPITVDGSALPDQEMRVKFLGPREAHRFPELFRPNPFANSVLYTLGLRRMKRENDSATSSESCPVMISVSGRVAIMREEDPETGQTSSLSQQQLDAIRGAHHQAISGPDLGPWRTG